jgi:hypothetical protein
MSQHGSTPESPSPNPGGTPQYAPQGSFPPAQGAAGYQAASAPAGYQPAGYQPNFEQQGGKPPAKKARNTIGLIALIIAAVGFIFACIPGALIVGWILLPIAFILSIVSFFQKGKGKGLGIAALIVSVVGTIVGAIVFFAVVAASFNEAFEDTTSVDVGQVEEEAPAEDAGAAPADEPADDAAEAEGTRDNPVPVGTSISSDEWTVTVDAYNPAGNEIVAAANQFNEPAPAGSHYEIVTYTVTYTGEDSGMALMVGLDLVTAGGNVIDGSESLAALEDEIGFDELFNGASATGSTAFIVPDGESVLVRVTPGMFADEVFVQP